MPSFDKLVERLLRGEGDANWRFDDLRSLLSSAGFDERIRGSHHIFTAEGVQEILNLQPLRSGNAKTYQVRQVRAILWKYGRLRRNEDESPNEV